MIIDREHRCKVTGCHACGALMRRVKATGGGGGPRIFLAIILLFNIIVAFEISLETSGQRTRENRYSRHDGLKREGGFCIYDPKIRGVIQIQGPAKKKVQSQNIE